MKGSGKRLVRGARGRRESGQRKDPQGHLLLSWALPFSCCVIVDKPFSCLLSSGKWKFGYLVVMHPSQNGYFTNDCSFTLHFVWTGPAAMVTENLLVLCPCHFHGKSQLLGWAAAMRDNNPRPRGGGTAHCLAGHQLEQGGIEAPRERGQLRMAPELPRTTCCP